MADDIKVGDVVVLNSGGPEMTVEEIEDWNNSKRAWCTWFDGKKNQRGAFQLASLKKAGPPLVG